MRRFEITMKRCAILVAVVAAAGALAVPALAQQEKQAVAAKRVAAPPNVRKKSPYRPEGVTQSANAYYQAVWGIDNLLVRYTASGNLIRFSYRVVDSQRAKVLGDKKATPYLVGQRSHAVLQVPVMNKVGELRQTSAGTAAKQDYWMVFSNKGNLVKPGDRVDVIIGSFQAVGLVVE
jgi:hypothetical protein